MNKINRLADSEPGTRGPLAEPATQRPGEAATVHALCIAVLPVWVEQLKLAQQRSEQAVFDMLQAFSMLTQSEHGFAPQAAPAVVSAGADSDQVERMYRGFQYQDQLNQMLELLVRDMQRLFDQLGHGALCSNGCDETANPAQWLERLRSEYVMQEQRLAGSQGPAAAASQQPDDLTFF